MIQVNKMLLGQFLLQAICSWLIVETVDVKIGGLFDHNAIDAKRMLQHATKVLPGDEPPKLAAAELDVEYAEDPDVLAEGIVHFQAVASEVSFGDGLQASRKVCRYLGKGVAAIFGPMSAAAAIHTTNICDSKDIPYVDFRWDAETKPPVINMMPHPVAMAEVFVELVKHFKWQSFTILYETASWLPRVSGLLSMYDPKDYTVSVRRLVANASDPGNYRSVLRAVRLSADRQIVLECSVDTLPEVLKQAMQVGLMTDQHHFIITTLDMHTIDLEPYQYSRTSITGVRLVDPESALMQSVAGAIAAEVEELGGKAAAVPDGLTAEHMLVQTALVYDAVKLLGAALQQLDASQLEARPMECDSPDSWEHGISITNYMRNTIVDGLSGEVRFDHEGLRKQFALGIVQLTESGLGTVGQWNSSTGLNFSEPTIDANDLTNQLFNKTFTVIIALNTPYVMLSHSSDTLSGNARYEGFCIDLIKELSLLLGFNYTFRVQEDKQYGARDNVTGEWNGMIRELHEHRADLAITDLTMTSERNEGADFTMPFMSLGISILFRKPTKEEPSILSFMSPFSMEVWMCLGGAYLGVSVCLFVLGRISPFEWDNPYPCIDEPTELKTQFSLANALWFAIGAILQQGTEIAPKAPSTRVVASFWWFFTLIIVSSYTANLAAFLTVEKGTSLITGAESLKDCHKQPDKCPVKFGAKQKGSTINFFTKATHDTYKQINAYMEANTDLSPSSDNEGKQWVLNKTKNYAFFMESSSIDYIIERECELDKVGRNLDDKGYGIAMRKNSTYRDALSTAVLRLQEDGKLTALKIRWWKEKNGGGACEKTGDNSNAMELGMPNMNGVFIVCLSGCLAAWLIGIFACVINTFNKSRKYGDSFREELWNEFLMVALCHGNTKPVRHRKSASLDTTKDGRSQSANSSRNRSDMGLSKA